MLGSRLTRRCRSTAAPPLRSMFLGSLVVSFALRRCRRRLCLSLVVRPLRRGSIGLIGASGTGLQQVSCLIDRMGEGVSQVIGVGGRDLDEQVGGTMMLAAFERLSVDPGQRSSC